LGMRKWMTVGIMGDIAEGVEAQHKRELHGALGRSGLNRDVELGSAQQCAKDRAAWFE
jgi:hypothetical protein